MAKIDALSNQSKPKVKYQVTNWREYNAGLKQRGSLSLWIDDSVAEKWYHQESAKRGGQMIYSEDCILLLLTMKVTFRLAFRQLEGFTSSIFALMGVDLPVPSYTQICRRQAGLKVPAGISERLKKGGHIYIVVDSSGLKVYGEGEWKVRQHGLSKRRTWRKIHLGVDEKTGEIVAQRLTENSVDDAEIAPKLLKDALKNGLNIDRFAADGAYDKRKCYDWLIEHDVAPIIPPRRDAQYWLDEQGEVLAHPRNFALIDIDEGGMNESREQWKIDNNYHRRSLSETTFFRWKITFGERLAARKFENQKTEAAVKAAVLNKFIQTAKPVSVRKSA